MNHGSAPSLDHETVIDFIRNQFNFPAGGLFHGLCDELVFEVDKARAFKQLSEVDGTKPVSLDAVNIYVCDQHHLLREGVQEGGLKIGRTLTLPTDCLIYACQVHEKCKFGTPLCVGDLAAFALTGHWFDHALSFLEPDNGDTVLFFLDRQDSPPPECIKLSVPITDYCQNFFSGGVKTQPSECIAFLFSDLIREMEIVDNNTLDPKSVTMSFADGELSPVDVMKNMLRDAHPTSTFEVVYTLVDGDWAYLGGQSYARFEANPVLQVDRQAQFTYASGYCYVFVKQFYSWAKGSSHGFKVAKTKPKYPCRIVFPIDITVCEVESISSGTRAINTTGVNGDGETTHPVAVCEAGETDFTEYEIINVPFLTTFDLVIACIMKVGTCNEVHVLHDLFEQI